MHSRGTLVEAGRLQLVIRWYILPIFHETRIDLNISALGRWF